MCDDSTGQTPGLGHVEHMVFVQTKSTCRWPWSWSTILAPLCWISDGCCLLVTVLRMT